MQIRANDEFLFWFFVLVHFRTYKRRRNPLFFNFYHNTIDIYFCAVLWLINRDELDRFRADFCAFSMIIFDLIRHTQYGKN